VICSAHTQQYTWAHSLMLRHLIFVSGNISHWTLLLLAWNLKKKNLKLDSRRLQGLKACIPGEHLSAESKGTGGAQAKLSPSSSLCQIFCEDLHRKLVFTRCQNCLWYVISILKTIMYYIVWMVWLKCRKCPQAKDKTT
jgi:hypothetical protein